MSRVGKQPITIPAGVSLTQDGQTVTVKGPKGELSYTAPQTVKVTVDGSQVSVERAGNSKEARAMHGTVRALIASNLIGVSEGYKKQLEIQGVGFKGVLNGRVLTLSLGYSHEIQFPVPEGLLLETTSPTEITISGCDKQKVGQAAAQIRSYYKAEPYKGKGVRYKGEQVRRKTGKAVS